MARFSGFQKKLCRITGDIILQVAGRSVSSPADVRKEIASARTEGKRTVLLRVKSGDNTRFVALPVGNG